MKLPTLKLSFRGRSRVDSGRYRVLLFGDGGVQVSPWLEQPTNKDAPVRLDLETLELQAVRVTPWRGHGLAGGPRTGEDLPRADAPAVPGRGAGVHVFIRDGLDRPIGHGVVTGCHAPLPIGLRAHADWDFDWARADRIPRHFRASTLTGPAVERQVDTGKRSRWLGPWSGGAGWRSFFSVAVAKRRKPIDLEREASFGPLAQYIGQNADGTTRFNAMLMEQGLLTEALGPAHQGDHPWLWEIVRFAQATGIPRRSIDNGAGQVDNTEPAAVQVAQDLANTGWIARGIVDDGGLQDAKRTDDTDLLNRLIGGLCPHEPHVVSANGHRHLVWAFAWHGDGAERLEQDGVWLAPGGASSAGRMPDLEVWSTAVEPLAGPVRFTHPAGLCCIRVRWPGAAWVPLTPSAGATGAPDSVHPWDHAKRLVRQAMLVAGQIDWHVARGHFYVEQLCVALCSHLRSDNRALWDDGDHPLLALLWPFIRSADQMNRFGEETLFTGSGLLSAATSLSREGTTGRLRRQLVSWGWHNFEPPAPLTPEDRFRKAGRVVWDAIGAFVADSDLELDALGAGQPLGDAVRHTLQRLVETMSDGVGPAAPWWSTGGDPPVGWPLDPDVATERVAAPVALTTARTPPVAPASWKALAQHAIWCATFLHDWIGGSQFHDGSQVLRAPLGLQWDRMPRGGESLATHGPPPAHAGLQLALSELIGRHRWGELGKADVEREPGSHAAAYAVLVGHIGAALDQAEAVGELTAADRAALVPQIGRDGGRIRGRINV